jgi:glycosyltransferase involved in cell wall biosynthesis
MSFETRQRILIVCSHFWPSRGGLESHMGQLGAGLVEAGHEVTVLTQHIPGRPAGSFHGVTIWGVPWAALQATTRQAVASGDWQTCILAQDPLGFILWSVDGLDVPAGTRVLMQPIINDEGHGRWKDHPSFGARLARLLRSADAAITMTRSGPDQRFMRAAGVPAVYLPNATAPTAPGNDFRRAHGIAPDRFLVLHVANLYWVKNHIGLADALDRLPPSWQLVMIGHPSGSADCVAAVQRKLAARPDILHIPGAPAEDVAAAMQAADVVVLASHGEGSPITLLEAMSHGKPWIATPTCGAANDHLGGIVCGLPDFRPQLQALADNPALARRLGAIGRRHWEQCHAWPVVLQGWLDLVQGGPLQHGFDPSPELVAEMAAIRKELPACGTGPTAVPAGAVALVDAAQGLLQQGRSADAIALYRRWLQDRADPLAFAVAYNLGIALETRGDIDQAADSYRRSLADRQDFAPTRLALARVLARLGHRNEPLQHAQWVLAHAADPATQAQAATLARVLTT